MHYTLIQTLAVLSCICVVALFRRHSQQRRRNPLGFPLPPGPKPLPVIGNLLDLPTKDETITYHQWAKRYGDLIYASALGRPMIFVNSAKVASDLFEKRSANYSDRTHLHMINDLMGWDWSFGMMSYGERWRQHRKLFHHEFQPSTASNSWPVQLRETHALLRRLLNKPEDLLEHLRHNAASTIFSVIYGIKIAESNDRYIDVAQQALDGLSKAAAPGAFLVDLFPFLKYVPEWIPGASFKKKAKNWKKVTQEMVDAPFAAVKHALSSGKASPCFTASLLESLIYDESVGKGRSGPAILEQEEIIKGCAGLAYAAGAESTVSALSSFILAMLVYPAVQEKAQTELDALLIKDNNGRLPEFSDRPDLPYVDAIVKETLRWNPVAPLGLPHMVSNDDTYDGYFIPAGTTIIGFSWEILHEESTYPDPLTFKPERFLTTDNHAAEPDPAIAAFGYGRRICPGRFMADASLWISIASILSAFDIRPALDPQTGKPEKVEARFASGMICHPLPFNFSITPRSAEAASLIRMTADTTL